MALTPAQLTTLKAAILANPTWNAQPMSNAGGSAIAALMNVPAVPAFIVNRTLLSRHEILTGTSSTGTTFTWTAGAYITRSQGERDAFREIFNSTGSVNPSLPSIKAAFLDIFSGAGGVANRAHIDALSKRSATVAEKLFATGAGTDASPATMTFEGLLAGDDVVQARELP